MDASRLDGAYDDAIKWIPWIKDIKEIWYIIIRADTIIKSNSRIKKITIIIIKIKQIKDIKSIKNIKRIKWIGFLICWLWFMISLNLSELRKVDHV